MRWVGSPSPHSAYWHILRPVTLKYSSRFCEVDWPPWRKRTERSGGTFDRGRTHQIWLCGHRPDPSGQDMEDRGSEARGSAGINKGSRVGGTLPRIETAKGPES